MDVDCRNFEAAKTSFKEKIQDASYIAIDLEMSGISLPGQKICAGETPAARFSKCKRVCERFGIVQCGICLFQEEKSIDSDLRNTNSAEENPLKLRAFPYNFYLFPRSIEDLGRQCYSSPNITLDASSIEFLRQNSMDFGRWISHGVTYVNRSIEENLQKTLVPHLLLSQESDEQMGTADVGKGQKKESGEDTQSESQSVGTQNAQSPTQQLIVLTRDSDKEWLAGVLESIEKDLIEAKEEELKLPRANTFLIKALRQQITLKWPHLTIEKRAFGNLFWQVDRFVMNLDEEEKKRKEEEDKKNKEIQYEQRRGFRAVWDLILESGKPIVVIITKL